jgi:hypothetical protein
MQQRSFGIAGASLFILVALPATLRAQHFGDVNDARLLSSVSAAALGQAAGVSLGLSSPSISYGGALAVGDFALGPGALRIVAGHPKDFEAYGLGYGAPLVRHPFTSFVSTTLGAEMSLGYLAYRLRPPTIDIGNGTYLNAHLALPLGLQLGNRRFSFTPYVAPYAEVGAGPSGYWFDPAAPSAGQQACQDLTSCRFLFSGHHRTNALGTAAGVRLSVWRLGLDAAYGDFPGSHLQLAKNPMSIAFSLRF